tara:strand:+ start:354 stop:1319 length:966 start_codon:yes stop_codon:yes gene_type:complete
MIFEFEKKFFSYRLSSDVKNSNYKIKSKNGWIIKIKNKNNELGYGEISPISKSDFMICKREINQIPKENDEISLLESIKKLHPCIQSGIICAIAEIKGQLKFRESYPFKKIDQSAILLDSYNIVHELNVIKKNIKYKDLNITIKWKVGIQENLKEEKILEKILCELPSNYKLRIDANGAWSRKLANNWADILKNNKNLDWLEQPLAPEDYEGHRKLNKKIPIALDESLLHYPDFIKSWEGWQIRRPSQEKNPLQLLEDLTNDKYYVSISSSFETGIGRRMLFHCAFIQLKGRTPKVPGLALAQAPDTFLFESNPNIIWENL